MLLPITVPKANAEGLFESIIPKIEVNNSGSMYVAGKAYVPGGQGLYKPLLFNVNNSGSRQWNYTYTLGTAPSPWLEDSGGFESIDLVDNYRMRSVLVKEPGVDIQVNGYSSGAILGEPANITLDVSNY